jgi:putative two-component system response regulator
MKKTIFLVDNNPQNLIAAEEILANHYRVFKFSCAREMFEALEKTKPNLILLDVNMPETGGFETAKKLKEHPAYYEIPVIFLLKHIDSESEVQAIKLGAVDFILKPFSESIMLDKLKKRLHLDKLIHERTVELLKRTEQIKSLKNGLVYTMADLVENRDEGTGGHIERTSVYMRTLIDAMLANGVYADEINEWDLELVVSSSRLHDVGKIEIPDCILNKPGTLTAEEFDAMKGHSAAGESILDKAIARTGDEEFLYNAKIIATYHHERWNGTGYPYGMKDLEIPLQARIMSIIDVYDALVSERPYKKALTHEKAVEIILEESGRHFDPSIVDVFRSINEEIREIKDQF